MVDVLKLTKHPSYGKSEVICNEGDRLATLFIVNEGMVKLSKFNAEGKEQILTLIGEGEIFGEYHLFSDYEPYNFTARAITDVKLCTLSKEQMDGLLDQHPVISRKILAELSAKLILTEKLVQNLATVSSEAKVAYVLLFLADKYGVKDSEGI